MSVRSLNMQDQFLNSLRRSKTPVSIFLTKGLKLQGSITGFDTFSLTLRRDGVTQLVYKHAISTILAGDRIDDLDDFARLPAAPNSDRPAVQDQFLTATAAEGGALKLYLLSGVMLQGQIVGYDQFSLLLERSDQVQLVYKHAISTIQPDPSGKPTPANLPVRVGEEV